METKTKEDRTNCIYRSECLGSPSAFAEPMDCSRCNRFKPITIEFYSTNVNGSQGTTHIGSKMND